jgi:hypothetical protein
MLARRTFLLCCLATTLIYPGPGFALLLEHNAGATLLLNLRNLLLTALLALMLFRRDKVVERALEYSQS